MYGNADCEKTQAPPDVIERDMRERLNELRMTAQGCDRPLMSDADIVAEFFKYHPPSDLTIPKYAAINQAAKNFAEVVLQNCPRSADRSAAIRSIRDARMTANAAVALNGLSL